VPLGIERLPSGPPLRELLRRLQRDAAPLAGAKVVDRDLGGLLK